jgi:DNA-binding HxlR family transcriptional regulator
MPGGGREGAGAPAFDVYDDRCPTRLVLDRLGDKWALLILSRLEDGPLRFNRLRRDIRGLSQKVLSQTLKKLERDGLLTRTVFATVPVTVEYELTPLGRTLADTAAALTRWAERNMAAVLAAQQAYDAREGTAGRPSNGAIFVGQ